MYNSTSEQEGIVPIENPAAGQFHNPGFEHLKSIYYLKEAQAKAPLQAASIYILPLMAIQSARLSIDEYVNRMGQKMDLAWDEADRLAASIHERIAYIYEKTGQPLSFKTGIWKDVLALFETSGLIKGNLLEMRKLQRDDIPENFKDIAVEYPIYRTQAIAEEAIDLLLDLSFSVINSRLKGNSNLQNT